jgi:hypothetical protein
MCIETHPPNSLTRKIRSTPTKLISRGQNKTRMHEAKLDLIRHCAPCISFETQELNNFTK